ncbi:MAG: glutamate--cysteine ligase [Bdellovibrionales bacterium]|nr:glutamate--cysteine ligase [Bdellovibrionales bacterium]
MNFNCTGRSLRCDLVDRIFAHQEELDTWYRGQADCCPVPPYTSIDVRDSGFKIAPVDSNIFPAGFNNICTEDWGLASRTFRHVLQHANNGHTPRRVMIVPESHTNNRFYFENLRALREILTLAGFEVVIGHLNPELKPNLPHEATAVETASGRTVVLERIVREGNQLHVPRVKFDAQDLILLNNDLSNGVPPELEGLSQTLTPHPSIGWHRRKKSEHLHHYTALATEFARILGVDPWVFTARFDHVDGLHFDTGEGLDRLAAATDRLLAGIADDYRRHDVAREPFVYIKHNSGTYGRSIMVVKSGQEVLEMNRREKNKMHVSKGGVQVGSVVLMEGIPTGLSEDGQTAEPVIYMAGSDAVGGFLRLNPNRDAEGNLNSPGAHFKPLCFENLFRNPQRGSVILEKLYGALGKLSALANGREMQ